MRSHLLRAVLAIGILTGTAHAAYRPPVESEPMSGTRLRVGALVRVNRRTVLTLRRPSGDTPPEARAALVAERLSAAIRAGLAPGAVRARRAGGQFALLIGEKELIRPTPADAREAGTTPRRLAFRWAAALRQALALPPLTVSARALLVPFGESRALRVGGAAAGPLAVSAGDPAVATAELAGDGRNIRVRAEQPGVTDLVIEAEGAAIGVRVVVKKYAGEAATPVTVDCTGRPAPADLIHQLVMESYEGALRLEWGAAVEAIGRPHLPGPLPPGQEGWATVPVRLGGPGLLPCRAAARVRVRCRRLPPREPDALLYSNDPEQIRQPGRLYVGAVEANAPRRLLYHHQNISGQAVDLRLDLINPAETPVELQVINGAARPVIDTVLAGHRAGVRYLRNAQRDVGRIVTLPGRSRRSLLRQQLASGYTASGLYGLRLLSGQRVLVEVRADPPSAGEPEVPQPETVTVARHVYANPRRVLEASYTVGQNWTFVRLGKKAKVTAHPAGEGAILDGDYGVLYDISVRLDNPTREARTVKLMLAPDAGGARGVFLVEGRWIEAPHVSPPAEFELAQFVLAPQEHRVVTIRTLPVGGSAYPVTLVVR